MIVKHNDQNSDIGVMAEGVRVVSKLMNKLESHGLVGERLVPPLEVDINNNVDLCEYIKHNHFTVFHWCCSCRAGVGSEVVDELFRLRGPIRSSGTHSGSSGMRKSLANVYIGSAASLPEIPEPNPHLSISAFSYALSNIIHKKQCNRYDIIYSLPLELQHASEVISTTHYESNTITRPGDEVPYVQDLALKQNMTVMY